MAKTRGGNLPRWTDDEVATLKRHYRGHGPDWEGWETELPGRNRNAIYCMAMRQGLKTDVQPNTDAYTDKEREIVARFYPKHGPSWEGWANLLPGRNTRSITKAASRLGIHPQRAMWTEAEDAKLQAHYPEHGPRWDGWPDILPGRDENAISRRASRLGIRKRPKARPCVSRSGSAGKWSREQDEYLLHQLAAIARRTGHNAYEVVERMNELQGRACK